MGKQKPPKPEGKLTDFPYSLIWEEFGEIWEDLVRSSELEREYERLLAKRANSSVDGVGEPDRERIAALVQPLEISGDAERDLISKLYRIAAAFRVSKLKNELGEGPLDTKARLEAISSHSAGLADRLKQVSLELEVLVGLARSRTGTTSTKPQFNFRQIISELRDLGAATEHLAIDIPVMPQGKSVDILQARLMEAATRAIGNASSVELKVKGTDSAGRNPRPASVSAEVLFSFLQAVDPSMTDATKVRLFRGFNRAWKSISGKELTGLPPRSWTNHAARVKLAK